MSSVISFRPSLGRDKEFEFSFSMPGVTDCPNLGPVQLQEVGRKFEIEIESDLVHGRRPMMIVRDRADPKALKAVWNLRDALATGTPPSGEYPLSVRLGGAVHAAYVIQWIND